MPTRLKSRSDRQCRSMFWGYLAGAKSDQNVGIFCESSCLKHDMATAQNFTGLITPQVWQHKIVPVLIPMSDQFLPLCTRHHRTDITTDVVFVCVYVFKYTSSFGGPVGNLQ